MSSTILSPLLRSSRSKPTTTICQSCAHTLRQLSTSSSRPSYIGKTPIIVPSNVTISVYTPPPPTSFTRNPPFPTATVSGPLGTLTIPIPPYVSITSEPIGTKDNTTTTSPDGTTSSRFTISVQDPKIKEQHAMWGTTRAYLQNHVLGVTEGHAAILRFVGVGYRAIVEEKVVDGVKKPLVNLKLGYSHPIEMVVPDGVKAQAPVPTRLLLEGADRQVVMQFAADIREWRKPEPYKGKVLKQSLFPSSIFFVIYLLLFSFFL